MKIKSIVASLFLVAASLNAQATTIDFRTLAVGTAVTDQYEDFTASLSGGNASGAPTIAYYTYGSYGGLSNSPTSGNYPTAQFLNIKFTSAVDALSFKFDNEGYNGGNAWFTYDANNHLLETGALNTYNLIRANQFGANGISSISFSNGRSAAVGYDNWTQALSVLNYNRAPIQADVPEPVSIMLIGVGLAGLAAARRRMSI